MNIAIPMLDFARTGGSRVLSELANTWVKMGHSVTMVVHQSSPMPYFPTRAIVVWLDDAGRQVDASVAGSRPGSGWVALSRLRALYQGLNRYAREQDIVLA